MGVCRFVDDMISVFLMDCRGAAAPRLRFCWFLLHLVQFLLAVSLRNHCCLLFPGVVAFFSHSIASLEPTLCRYAAPCSLLFC